MSYEDKQQVCSDCSIIAKNQERKRIIDLLIKLDAIRYDAFGHLVAFNTTGTDVIYLDGVDPNE